MSRSLLVLFGTQNGNAKSIATDLYHELQSICPHCTLSSMGEYAKRNPSLPMNEALIVVLSTTGNGEPPDDARPFLRALRKRIGASEQQPSLLYSILGLGDSEYTNFNAAAKNVHQLLGKLGATVFHPCCWADDARGLATFVEPWKTGLRTAVRGLMSGAPSFPHLVPAPNASSVVVHLMPENVAARMDIVPDSQMACTSPELSAPNDATTCASEGGANKDEETLSAPSISIEGPTEPAEAATHTALSVATGEEFALEGKHKMTPPAREGGAKKSKIAEMKKRLGISHSPRQKEEIEVTFLDGLPSMEEPFLARWKAIETERELRGYTPETPFMAAIIGARFLTTPKSLDRAVLHLELQLPGQDGALTYSPGDAVGIHAPNPLFLADAVIQRLKLDGSQTFSLSRGVRSPGGTDQKGMSSVLPHIYSPCTVDDAFRYCCDLTSIPSKALLLMLASHCSNTAESQAAKQLTADLSYDILCASKPNFLELLHMFPSCNPPLAEVLTVLPPLMPRYYSITSSPCSYPDKLHLALTIVQYTTAPIGSWAPKVRQGLCSNWLNQVAQRAGVFPEQLLATQSSRAVKRSNRFDSPLITAQVRKFEYLSDLPGVLKGPGGLLHIPAFIRRSTAFILPSDVSRGIIMVGPGTGVAPFRGFVQHRHTEVTALKSGGRCLGHWRGLDFGMADEEEDEEDDGKRRQSHGLVASLAHTHLHEGPVTGKMMLFFGCRHPDQDFLYKDDWAFFVRSGTLSEFHTSFSRLNEHKEYVQSKLRQNGPTVVEQIVKHNSYFFVCGDGTRMAKEVMLTITELLQEHAAMSKEQAKHYVHEMVQTNRYVQDIWS